MAATQSPTIEEFQVSPRKTLRPGMRFRTLRGSGPRHIRTGAAWGVYATFRCLRIYPCRLSRRRLLCEATNERTGGRYTLQLCGPARKVGGIEWRPYKIAICREQEGL